MPIYDKNPVTCKCGEPHCRNEIQIDTEGGTMLCTKEIELSGVKTSEPIFFYMDVDFAKAMIAKLQEYIQKQKEK